MEKRGEVEKINQERLFEIITGKEISWHEIIYDLINSEQLDPWDVDIALLAQRYLEKIKLLEEANFVVSSKVLLAASILLRIKSELLLNHYIKNIDNILFGKKPEQKKPQERIIIDESEIPFLYPRTPLPRHKKISLDELMNALDHAMNTEVRRIKKEVRKKQAEFQNDIILPKMGIKIKDRIRAFYARFLTAFAKKNEKISYSELTRNDREEKLACFLPMLHLTNQQRLFLQQEKHFDEIWLWLYKHYKKLNPIEEGVAQEIEKNIGQEEKLEEIHNVAGFNNPLANFFEAIEGNR